MLLHFYLHIAAGKADRARESSYVSRSRRRRYEMSPPSDLELRTVS